MRKLTGLLALALLCGASPAMATNWYVTGESVSGSSMTFVDKDSIEGSGTVRRAQVYVVFARTQEDGETAVDALMEFDCAEPRSRFLRLVGFNEAGDRLSEEQGSGRWSPVAPGTQDSSSRAFICSGGRSAPASDSRGAAYPFAGAREVLARHRAEDAK